MVLRTSVIGLGLLVAVALGFFGTTLLMDAASAPRANVVWQAKAIIKTLNPSGHAKTKAHKEGALVTSWFRKLPQATGKTLGAHFVIPAKVEALVSGKKVVLEIDASPARLTDRGQQMGVAYSTWRVGNSGWREIEMARERKTYSISYRVPHDSKKGSGLDYIGILSDMDGRGKPIILHAARLYLDQ